MQAAVDPTGSADGARAHQYNCLGEYK